jgi:hypothetical protein
MSLFIIAYAPLQIGYSRIPLALQLLDRFLKVGINVGVLAEGELVAVV